MAITQLGAATTFASTSNPATSITTSVTLLAGSNRRLLALVGARAQNSPGPAPAETLPTVTYAGIPMGFMPRPTDGAGSFLTATSATIRMSCLWYCLRESELPANGAHDLVVDWPGIASASNWQIRGGAVQYAGLDQQLRIRDHRRLSSGAGTSLGGSTLSGGTSDAIVVGTVNATTLGNIAITIDGVGVTEDFEMVIGASGGRVAMGSDLSAGALTGIPFLSTYTNGGNAVTIGLRLAEFFSPTPGARSVVDSAPFGQSVVTADTIQTVSLIGQEQ